MSIGKRLLGKAAPAVVRGLRGWLRKKNPQQVQRLGERLGRLWMRRDRKRRDTAIENLGMAMPALSRPEREALTERVFVHFGRAAIEFLAGTQETLEQIESTTDFEGTERLDAALAQGKGVLLITGHIGNWERVSAWLSMKGYKLNVVARDADQGDLNQLVNERREGPGTRVIPRGNAARPILERLKANEIVGILPDQNAEDIFIPFFGKPAGTNLGPGVIQARTQSVVLPVYCVRQPNGRYRMVFDEYLEPDPGFETKGEGLMRAINRWLEGVIRAYPEQWLWVHDRWRNARRQGLL